MATTRIVLPYRNIADDGPQVFEVEGTFDDVLEKLTPAEQAETPEQVRHNLTFTQTNGKRCLITPPPSGWWVEEL